MKDAVKINANFPGNPQKGLPTIQGLVALYDGDNGQPLAVMDSIEVTALRTAAATAVAAKARPSHGAMPPPLPCAAAECKAGIKSARLPSFGRSPPYRYMTGTKRVRCRSPPTWPRRLVSVSRWRMRGLPARDQPTSW